MKWRDEGCPVILGFPSASSQKHSSVSAITPGKKNLKKFPHVMKNSARELQHLGSGLDFITVMKLHKPCLLLPVCCAASRSLCLSSAASALRAGDGREAGRTHQPLPPSSGFPGLGSPRLHHWHAAPGRTASALAEMRTQSRAVPHPPLLPALLQVRAGLCLCPTEHGEQLAPRLWGARCRGG